MLDRHKNWLSALFSIPERREVIDWLCLHLPPCDTVVVRGVSGLGIGSIVAHAFDAGLTVVRKPGEDCHSDLTVEGRVTGKAVILDEFVVSGRTVRAIMKALRESAPMLDVVALCLYYDHTFRDASDFRPGRWVPTRRTLHLPEGADIMVRGLHSGGMLERVENAVGNRTVPEIARAAGLTVTETRNVLTRLVFTGRIQSINGEYVK